MGDGPLRIGDRMFLAQFEAYRSQTPGDSGTVGVDLTAQKLAAHTNQAAFWILDFGFGIQRRCRSVLIDATTIAIISSTSPRRLETSVISKIPDSTNISSQN